MSKSGEDHPILYAMEQLAQSGHPEAKKALAALALWTAENSELITPKNGIELAETDGRTAGDLLPVRDLMPRYVFADSSEKTPADLQHEKELEKRAEDLNAEIQSKLAPVVEATRLAMPPYPTENDKAMFGILRKVGTKVWHYAERFAGMDLIHRFMIVYTPDKTGNRPVRLMVRIANEKNETCSDHSLYINFSDDTLSKSPVKSIILVDHRKDDGQLRKLLNEATGLNLHPTGSGQNAASDMLGGGFNYQSDGVIISQHSFHTHILTIDDEPIVLEHINTRDDDSDKMVRLIRAFDPMENKFVPELRWGSKRLNLDVEASPRDQILAFVSGALSLIPMRNTDDFLPDEWKNPV